MAGAQETRCSRCIRRSAWILDPRRSQRIRSRRGPGCPPRTWPRCAVRTHATDPMSSVSIRRWEDVPGRAPRTRGEKQSSACDRHLELRAVARLHDLRLLNLRLPRGVITGTGRR